jgi:hypothetical protein
MTFMNTRNARTAAEVNARKTLARQRGEIYLEVAERYRAAGDEANAHATAIEGLRLAAGPFYLAVRDKLQDFLSTVPSAA